MTGKVINLYDGSKQFSPVGTAASNLLQSDPAFRDVVLSVGGNLEPMTGQAVRIDFKPERTSANVAFGHLKLAAYLYKNPDGGIGVVGVAKDAYNFEWWGYKPQLDEYNLNNLYDELKRGSVTALNNAAYLLQTAGEIKPYKYGVQVNTVIYAG